MITTRASRLAAILALAVGVALLLVAIRYTDWTLIAAAGTRLLWAAAASIAISGVWHLVRTFAWAACFPAPRQVGVGRLFRVRIAAEAVSYVTLSSLAGDPLKVVLLAGDADRRDAGAAVALDRLAYLVGTSVIVGLGALVALAALPLSRLWTRIFIGFAVGAGVVAVGTVLVLISRRTYLSRLATHGDKATITARVARFVVDVEVRLLATARREPRRLAVLAGFALLSYACMAIEAYAILRVVGVPVSVPGAIAIETFSRVSSFASAMIPANLGALEAASLAAASAAGVAGGGPLALARRVRGLFWAAFGFAVYPRRFSPPLHAPSVRARQSV